MLYGKEINKSNVFHAYCSIFDTYHFTYHGSSIKPIINDDKQFSTLISVNSPDLQVETDILKSFIKFSSNSFNNTVYDISYINSPSIKIEIFDVSKLTPNDLFKWIGQTGIIIISEKRKHPFVIGKIENDDIIITESTIINVINVLEYDGYNLKLLN